MWVIKVPLAFLLAHFTGINILTLYLICQLVDLSKVFLGYYLIKKGVWINNIVDEPTKNAN